MKILVAALINVHTIIVFRQAKGLF